METDAEIRSSSSILRYGDAAVRHTCPVFAHISHQIAKSRKNKDLLAEDAVLIGPVSGPQFPANREMGCTPWVRHEN